MAKRTNDYSKFGDKMHLARFLHQDKLMWGRLQTLMAIQTAAIALAWYNRDSAAAAITMMGFGLAITTCLCGLYFVDRSLRNEHSEKLGRFHQPLTSHPGLAQGAVGPSPGTIRGTL